MARLTNKYASQIEFRPAGRGFVQVVFVHPSGEKVVEVLQYAEQGRLVGLPPVDVSNAKYLNEAAENLNTVLRGL